MEKRYIIGVDVGTTGTKALVFAEEHGEDHFGCHNIITNGAARA